MKIAISFPALESKKGTPCLTQNRQFQWFSDPTLIYPVIPASAATLLKKEGHQVFWDDGIAENLSYQKWLERILKNKPDLIAIESKTPIIKKHWKIIAELKDKLPRVKIVLMGDHVAGLPEESLKKSKVDYVITFGDYDFALSNLVKYLTQKEPLTGGFWLRNNNDQIISTGQYNPLLYKLENLPPIDRELTKWKLYAYKNGNFKDTPGAYLMSSRDCWWGKCSFCSWAHTLFPKKNFRLSSPQKALAGVESLIKLGAKEIMEDSGTLPVGKWLNDFCKGMITKGFNKKIKINCNMRLNAIKKQKTWQLMKRAGFRMILFGMESYNQKTLDRLNKNLKISDIEPAIKSCKEAGLEPHLTAMIGYPWEEREAALNTLNFVRKLFKKGYLSSLQATLIIPYPGTPLYKYAKNNDLLITNNYSRFDQRELIMKCPLSNREAQKLIRSLYKSFITPKFFVRKMTSVRSLKDLKFYFKIAGKVLGHLIDFR